VRAECVGHGTLPMIKVEVYVRGRDSQPVFLS
jgi:hypothetical protein